MRPVARFGTAWYVVAIGGLLGVALAGGLAAELGLPAPATPPPAAGAEINPPAPDQESSPEVLTRGPIHEAFAAPVTTGGLQPLTVPKAPPPPVEEVPPDVKPEDEAAIWIPGYWAWDDDGKDFIWVSGVWRVPPAGSTWVAGYWTEVEGGWRWVPGFWTAAETQEATYYPEPPESLEQGPTSEPASPDYFWVPGCWEWRVGRYVWRAGYWAIVQPDWVWVPASYCWTPRGWVYVAGYWDFPFWRRGVLFAPVCFRRPVWRLGYVYRPAVVVDIGTVTLHLFARPICYHYYFGDYYAPVYERWGFYPWFSVYRYRHYHYDPLFVYCRWYYRHHDPRWESHLRGWHRYFRDHADLRPPRTLAEQRIFDERLKVRRDLDPRIARTLASTVTLAAPVSQFRKRPDIPVRLTDLPAATRQSAHQQARELRNLALQRRQIETEGVAPPVKLPGAKSPEPPLAGAGPQVKLPKPETKVRPGIATPPLGGSIKPGAAGPGKSKPGVPEMPKTRPGLPTPPLGGSGKPGRTPGPSQPQRLPLPRLPKLSATPITPSTGPSGPQGTGTRLPDVRVVRPPTGRVRQEPSILAPSVPKAQGVPGGLPTAPGVPQAIPKPTDTPPRLRPAPQVRQEALNPPAVRPGPPALPRVPSITPRPSGDAPRVQPRPPAPRLPQPTDVRPPAPQFRKTAPPPSATSFRRPPQVSRPGGPSEPTQTDASSAVRGGGSGPGRSARGGTRGNR